jgi:hypothetical protein
MACAMAAGTPFVVHEAYFTWPKLGSGAAAVVAFYLVLSGRPGRGGLAIAISYLFHPGGLLSAPTVALLWLFPPGLPHAGTTWTRRIRDPQFWSGALRLGCGILAGPLAWRLVNAGHFTQGDFLSYFLMNGTERALGLADWLHGRAVSLAKTVVPLAGYAHYIRSGEFGSRVTAFFHQYWCTAPFAFGIAATPWLVRELRAARRSSPRTFWSLVVAPLAVFTVYWGASLGGMMREGLHAWALSLVVVAACSHVARESAPRWDGLLLPARSAEVLAMLVVPSLVPATRLVRRDVLWTDLASVAVMVLGCAHIARVALQAARVPRPADAATAARWRRRARSTADA